MGFELCERVSPRARACTPLMAPSGYSRRTLSYLLFSAGCPEEARGKGEESAGEERGDGKTWGWREGGRDDDLSANIAHIAEHGIPSNTV